MGRTVNPMRCSRCGAGQVRVTRPKRYRYLESGLENVHLLGGVEITKCRRCGLSLISVPNELQLLQVIALALLGKPGPLAPADMKYLRKECDLTQAALAKVLGVTRETVVEREGGRPIDMDTEFRFRAVTLELFVVHLGDKSSNYLDKHHMKHLETLRCRFTRWAIERDRHARKTVRISHDGGWKLASNKGLQTAA